MILGGAGFCPSTVCKSCPPYQILKFCCAFFWAMQLCMIIAFVCAIINECVHGWMKVGHYTNKYLCYKWKCPPKSKNANTKLLGTQQDDSARCFSLAPNLYKTKVVKDTRPSRTFCEFKGHNSPTANKICFKKHDENSYLQRCFYCFICCRGFIVSGALYDTPDTDYFVYHLSNIQSLSFHSTFWFMTESL